jgi:hypothetical protein
MFSVVIGKADTATVPIVSLTENIPPKPKTQSECLEDELDLDLDLDIGNVVSISTGEVTLCLVTNFQVLSSIMLSRFEFQLFYMQKTDYSENDFIACYNDNVYTKHLPKRDKILVPDGWALCLPF